MASSKLDEINARIAELSAQAQAALKTERHARAQQLQARRRTGQKDRHENVIENAPLAPDTALQRRIQELTAKAYENMQASRHALAVQRLQERQEKRLTKAQAMLDAERAHAHAVEAAALARIRLEAAQQAAEARRAKDRARATRQSQLQEKHTRMAEALLQRKGEALPRPVLKTGILEVRTAMARHQLTVVHLLDRAPVEAVAAVSLVMTQFDIKIADILPSLRYTLAELQDPERRERHYIRSVVAVQLKAERRAEQGPKQKEGVTPPRYRDPVSHKTWNGIGRIPLWLSNAEKRGVSRDVFLIQDGAGEDAAPDEA